MMTIVEVINTRNNKVEITLVDNNSQVIQVDVRVLPNGKIIVEAEHLTGPDPDNSGLSFILEDEGKTAVIEL